MPRSSPNVRRRRPRGDGVARAVCLRSDRRAKRTRTRGVGLPRRWEAEPGDRRVALRVDPHCEEARHTLPRQARHQQPHGGGAPPPRARAPALNDQFQRVVSGHRR